MRKKLLSVVMSSALMLSVSGTALACPSTPIYTDYTGKVDLGDFELHVDIQGSANRSGSEPAVVFESGRDVDGSVWDDVADEISLQTQTFAYDRANIGLSDDSGGPYDAVTQAEQLHDLLAETGVSAPYILVTHSYGSAITTVFADLYPTEVAGIAFIDAAHVDQEAVTTDTFPIPVQNVFKANFVAEGGYSTITQTLSQAKTAIVNDDPLRDIPLEVLSATVHGLGPVIEATWADLQEDLLNLSDYSNHTIATGSGHYIMTDQPSAVVDVIENLL
ncbi:alpha/beta fold hydrolase [Paenibacillus sp. MMS18-CY102]|uniref:alpha/beta fold hydrolase n=1 Tax=Paenibacillus sp. MMS18-CY102 TaxID=2682849 RepID=UPI0013658619|nr:alpha/beta hydrolase [Paenibacillus sp. MMS18-CY102]MWC30628.1 alpha/beta fold hydrolase [Paenibacillus sp. MMS18-CY102]